MQPFHKRKKMHRIEIKAVQCDMSSHCLIFRPGKPKISHQIGRFSQQWLLRIPRGEKNWQYDDILEDFRKGITSARYSRENRWHNVQPFFIRPSTLFEKATFRTEMLLTILKRLFCFLNLTFSSSKVLIL